MKPHGVRMLRQTRSISLAGSTFAPAVEIQSQKKGAKFLDLFEVNEGFIHAEMWLCANVLPTIGCNTWYFFSNVVHMETFQMKKEEEYEKEKEDEEEKKK